MSSMRGHVLVQALQAEGWERLLLLAQVSDRRKSEGTRGRAEIAWESEMTLEECTWVYAGLMIAVLVLAWYLALSDE